jgi:hypothetical protein
MLREVAGAPKQKERLGPLLAMAARLLRQLCAGPRGALSQAPSGAGGRCGCVVISFGEPINVKRFLKVRGCQAAANGSCTLYCFDAYCSDAYCFDAYCSDAYCSDAYCTTTKMASLGVSTAWHTSVPRRSMQCASAWSAESAAVFQGRSAPPLGRLWHSSSQQPTQQCVWGCVHEPSMPRRLRACVCVCVRGRGRGGVCVYVCAVMHRQCCNGW